MPRFDIGPAAEFESRDGGLGTGGLIRNGFLEADKGGVWSWQRPGLAHGMTAPFTGTAMGLLLLGTELYGVGVETSGTASSYRITFGTSSFSLVAVEGTFTSGTTTIPAYGLKAGAGSVSPGTWNGAVVVELFGQLGKPAPPTIDPESYLTLAGSRAAGFISTVRVGSTTKQTSAASVSYAGGNTTWRWTGSPIFAGSTGTFAGGYT